MVECLLDGFVLSSWRLSVLDSGRSIIAEKHDFDLLAKTRREFQSDIIDQAETDGRILRKFNLCWPTPINHTTSKYSRGTWNFLSYYVFFDIFLKSLKNFSNVRLVRLGNMFESL